MKRKWLSIQTLICFTPTLEITKLSKKIKFKKNWKISILKHSKEQITCFPTLTLCQLRKKEVPSAPLKVPKALRLPSRSRSPTFPNPNQAKQLGKGPSNLLSKRKNFKNRWSQNWTSRVKKVIRRVRNKELSQPEVTILIFNLQRKKRPKEQLFKEIIRLNQPKIQIIWTACLTERF